MTYRSYPGRTSTGEGGYTNETWGYPQTLMMHDIAALQRIYGANYTFNAGDSVYRWSPTTGEMSINGVRPGRARRQPDLHDDLGRRRHRHLRFVRYYGRQ